MQKLKPFYRPGLISLILVCPLFLAIIKNKIRETDYRMLTITFWHSDWSTDDNSRYNLLWPSVILSGATTSEYSFTGADSDSSLLKNLRSSIKDLINNRDSTLRINIAFGKQSKYWELVEVLKICMAEKFLVCIPMENNILVYYSAAGEAGSYSNEKRNYDLNCFPNIRNYGEKDSIFNLAGIGGIFQKLWIPFSLYLILICMAVYRLIRGE